MKSVSYTRAPLRLPDRYPAAGQGLNAEYVTACYVRFETMRNGKRKSQKRKHPIPTVIGQKRRRRPIDENV